MLDRPTTEQIHRFQDGDEEIVVSTIRHPDGQYSAIEQGNFDSPTGWGFSTIGAIADLFEKMPRAASEREDRDDRAARFDHDRALRAAE